ncbi:MAG: carboxypeptidase regulatory-like domain-containing protein [Saprospiraceae bacterium]
MKNILFILLGAIMLLSSCREETIEPKLFGSVVGVVLLDNDENIAIDNARVSTNPATTSVVTDSLGRFSLDSIEVNTYTLRIEKKGFNTELEGVSVIEDRTLNIIIRMRPDSLDNTPPMQPATPLPENGMEEVETNITLSWEATDSDDDDELRYDVFLYNSEQTESIQILNNSLSTSVDLNDLRYGMTYFWQVVADDGQEEVNSPVWTFRTKDFPDHRFLFTREHSGSYDIFSSDAFGNEIQLTDGTSSSWRPKMNPQRNKIAYISNAGIESHLYTMNRDGSNVQRITSIPISGGNPLELDFCWSPDGSQLLYMNSNKLYAINQDGTGLRLVATAPAGFDYTTCDWTAQGDAIAVRTTGSFNHNSELYIINTDGEILQRVIADAPGSIGGAEFSINGNQLLFTRDVAGFEDASGRQLDSRIFLYDLTTFITTDISEEKIAGTNDLDAHFSPDGSKVIFVNTNNDGISPKNIYILDVENSSIDDRILLFENAEMPEWK